MRISAEDSRVGKDTPAQASRGRIPVLCRLLDNNREDNSYLSIRRRQRKMQGFRSHFGLYASLKSFHGVKSGAL